MRDSLRGIEVADVAVVGGGVIGLAVARALERRGLSVTLVESGETGAGASRAAGGMLAPQAEADRRDEFFDLLCASRDMYPDFARALAEESGVDVELDLTGTLYLAFDEHDEEELARRYSWQSGAGLEVERLTAEEARELEPAVSSRVRAALRFPRDWQVENRRLTRALTVSCSRAGVRVLTRTEALALRRAEDGSVAGVETSRGFAGAGAVVVAAGAWSSRIPFSSGRADDDEDEAGFTTEFARGSHPRVEPVRGQMLCFEHAPGQTPTLRHVVYSPRGYLVPRRDGRLLAGSTTERAGFDCSVTAGGLNVVTTHALEIAPATAGLRLTDAWAGLRPRASCDDWPVLGPSAEARNLFYATGHYRNGILLAPATGEALADILTSGASRILTGAGFSPERFRRAHACSHAY